MQQPRVGIVLGSSSDEERTQAAAVILEKFGVDHELEVLSAHRSPRRVAAYAASAEDRGLQVLIAAAGKAAALPGVLAAHTVLPVIGLPIVTPQLGGQDALYSIVQMRAAVWSRPRTWQRSRPPLLRRRSASMSWTRSSTTT